MGTSTGRQLHVDQILTQMAIGYRPRGIIADQIFPVVTVQKQSDYYTVFNRADALRIEDARRAPGDEAKKVTRSISSGQYFADNYALKYPVTIEDKANADPAFVQNLLNTRAQYLLDKLGLDWDRRVSLQCNSTSNVGSSAAVGSEWSAGNGDVLGDLNTALDAAEDLTGYRPNRAIFGNAAWRSARRSTDILNRVFGTNNGGGYAQRAQVASLIEIDEITVSDAYFNTANEAQAESLSNVWGDNVLLYYAPASPSVDVPSFGYTFRWAAPGLPNMTVERHPYDTRRKSEEIEVGYHQDEKITGSEYSFLLTAVNSST